MFIPKRKCNFYKFWWSQELNIMKEKAIESCRMWKNAGSPKSDPIYTQCKKTNYYIKSEFAKSRLTYMKLYYANLVKNFGRFGNQSSPMLVPSADNVRVDGVADYAVIGLANNFAKHFESICKSVKTHNELLKPNIMPLEHNTADL